MSLFVVIIVEMIQIYNTNLRLLLSMQYQNEKLK